VNRARAYGFVPNIEADPEVEYTSSDASSEDTSYDDSDSADGDVQLERRTGVVRSTGATKTLFMSKEVTTKAPAPTKFPQGSREFVAHMLQEIKSKVRKTEYNCKREDLFYHQLVCEFLVQPRSPIKRMLFCHQLGSGKTICIVRILEQFYSDPRPKFIFVPTTALAHNFYKELLTTYDNSYRSWLETKMTLDPNNKDSMERAKKLLSFFGNPRQKGEPGGPQSALRVLTHNEGGRAVASIPHITSLLHRDASDPENVYSEKIIIVDEAHFLVEPDAGDAARTRAGVKRLGERIKRSRDSVVALMTATPLVPSSEAKYVGDFQKFFAGLVHNKAEIMNITKGIEGSDSGDFGFVSWFMNRPKAQFAETMSRSRQTAFDRNGILQFENLIIKVPLRGKNLSDYISRRFGKNGVPKSKPIQAAAVVNAVAQTPPGSPPSALQRMKDAWSRPQDRAAAWVQQPPPDARQQQQRHIPHHEHYAPTFRGYLQGLDDTARRLGERRGPVGGGAAAKSPKSGNTMSQAWESMATGVSTKAAPSNFNAAYEMATKLAEVTNDVLRAKLKTVVFISARNGAQFLKKLLEKALGGKDKVLWFKRGMKDKSKGLFEQMLHDFNDRASNAYGEKHLVALLDPKDFSTGVSFMGVRKLIMTEISEGKDVKDVNWQLIKQRFGRALRTCSHDFLRDGERKLEFSVYVATLKDYNVPTLDEMKLQAALGQRGDTEKLMMGFEEVAVDRGLY
jgi:hypothetical protein